MKVCTAWITWVGLLLLAPGRTPLGGLSYQNSRRIITADAGVGIPLPSGRAQIEEPA